MVKDFAIRADIVRGHTAHTITTNKEKVVAYLSNEYIYIYMYNRVYADTTTLFKHSRIR